MAGGQYLSAHQQSIVRRYYAGADARLSQKLQEVISDLAVEADTRKVASLWQSAHTALKSTPADQMKVGTVIAQRDLKGLAALVEQMSKGTFAAERKPAEQGAPRPAAPTPPPVAAPHTATSPSAPTPSVAGEPPTHDQLKGALTAFKKRLKALRLDEESKISNRALTSGKKSAIVAIQPPGQYPKAVWDALVADKKLKSAGSGLYELAQGQSV